MSGREPDQLTLAPDGRPMTEQPKWRRDFPIDVPQDLQLARREFTKFLALTSFAFVAGQIWILAKSWLGRRATYPEREIARLADVAVGGSLAFDYPTPGETRLLVRTSERQCVAFDSWCTHLSCPVIPQVDRGRFFCPCHHGSFDLATGRPLGGPPQRPLPVVRLELRGDRVFAVGITERTT